MATKMVATWRVDEASKIYGFTFTSKANSKFWKFFQQKFTVLQAGRVAADP